MRTLFSLIFVCALSVGCSTPLTQKNSGVSQMASLESDRIIADDGYELPFRRYFPEGMSPKSIVIALHGFNDYSFAFDEMCQYFSSRGTACVAYDQRGFGQTSMKGIWPRKGRLQEDLMLVISLMRKTYPDTEIFVAGESMGGAVVITAANLNKEVFTENVSGIILYAPAVWARSTQPWYQKWALWLSVHTFPSWQPTGDGLGVQASDNIEALRAMGRDEHVIKATRIDAVYGLTNLMDAALVSSHDMPVKVLVLYGENDQVIPKNPTCLMLNSMKSNNSDLTFKLYSEGYHMLTRDLESARTFGDVQQWIDLQLAHEDSAVIDYCG